MRAYSSFCLHVGTKRLIYLVILLLRFSHVSSRKITIGLLLPDVVDWELGALRSAAYLAVDKINKDNFLQGDELVIEYQDSGCSPIKSAGVTTSLQYESDVDVYIGPHCSDSCTPAGLLAAYFKKPMISHACSSATLADKKLYPTFARTRPYMRTEKDRMLAELNNLLSLFKWNKLSIIVSNKVSWRAVAQYILSNLGNYDNKKFRYLHQFTTTKDGIIKGLTDILQRSKQSDRIILILAHQKQVAQILVEAMDLGMFDGKSDYEYVFITANFKILEGWKDESWLLGSTTYKKGRSKGRYAKDTWKEMFSGFLDFRIDQPNINLREKFNKQVEKRLKGKGIPPKVHTQKYKDKADPSAPYLYDAVYLYVRAYKDTKSQGKDPHNITYLMPNIFNRTFEGVLEDQVIINDVGNRVSDKYELRNFVNGKAKKICTLGSTCENEGVKDTIEWPCLKGPKRPCPQPPDAPKCGFKNDLCPDKDSEGVTLILVILFVVLFVAMILVFILFKKRKFERDLLGEGFFIKYQDIVNNCVNGGQNGRTGGSISSKVAVITTGLMFPESISIQSNETMDRNQFTYNGQTVIKKSLDKANANITREMLLEFKQVRELHNINLCTVVGVCIQSPSLCILMSYCSKGSLSDVLQNHDIKLDTMFKNSFSSDVACGATELHRNGIIHGQLHSENCVIDNRWVCKVTDFGMDKFKHAHSTNNNEEESDYRRHKKLFWRAPELIAKDPSKKSKEGDVYSYGIIISEILSREDPYADYGMDAKDIINLVNKRDDPPFRPKVNEEEYDSRLIALMKSCWSDIPYNRPSFDQVKAKLKRISGKQGNLVDNMIEMMEKYTNNLEELVDTRTEELAAEKLKTDDLLYKMLPRAITEQLKNGMQVKAESFECVTIFFSDIVGFTSLASDSTPMQVVTLLNDLYTCFDTCSDQYDVYKVETIGDAYMVVSGLPEKNGILHAGEIATLSLDLLHSIRTFKIRHLPDRFLQLRIGIHSGPCVAGVVGLKMPRYCLFGDTVNYASRMESSGLALRVHVSPECKSILDELGLYMLHDRGPVKMKGKGIINTYFLTGKVGFDKELPDLDKAAGLHEHEFK